MALRIEQNEDGTLHYIADGHIVLTGPTTGEVELPDGEIVNVTAAAIEVDSQEKAQLVAAAIQAKYDAAQQED